MRTVYRLVISLMAIWVLAACTLGAWGIGYIFLHELGCGDNAAAVWGLLGILFFYVALWLTTKYIHAENVADSLVINSLDQIPVFATDKEAADFWETHSLGGELLKSMMPPPEDLLQQPRKKED